jgi:hypothetical protein
MKIAPALGTAYPSGCSGLLFGQAANGGSETYQGRTVKDQVDADRDTNEVSAGCGLSGQQVDAQSRRDQARKGRPSPHGEPNDTGSD